MKTGIISVALSLLLYCASAAAEDDRGARTLDAVVVTGDRPGPKIWEFHRGKQRVWVLGTLQPLPKGTTFDTGEIKQRVAQSDVVLSGPGLVVGDNVSIFRGLTLWPAIRRSKFNQDGKALRDVLAPDTYARWLQAKAKYIGHDNGVDRLRPMYAAFELFEAAVRKADLNIANPVNSLIIQEAEKHKVPVTDAKLRLAISDPRNAVEKFLVSPAEDIRCLEQTLDRLDGFVRNASLVGEAWAAGSLAGPTTVPTTAMSTCWARLTNEAIGIQQGVSDLYHRVDTKWLDGLHRALREHDVVFTTLPVRDLLDSKGLAAALKQDGFQAISPAPINGAKE